MQPKPGISTVAPSRREQEVLRAVAAVQQGTGYGQVVVTIRAGHITVVNKTEIIALDGAYDR